MKQDSVSNYFVYNKEKVTKRVFDSNSNQLSIIINLMPGQTVCVHEHSIGSGMIYLIKGSLLFCISGKDVCAAEGDLISFNGREKLEAKNNTGINGSCMVVLSPNPGDASDIQEIGFQSGEPYNNL